MNTVVMPRYFGKTAYAIRLALKIGGPIAVARESTRQRILETAASLGVDPPEVILIEKDKPTAGVPAAVFIDYDL